MRTAMNKKPSITHCPYRIAEGSKIVWCEDLPTLEKLPIPGGYWVSAPKEKNLDFFSLWTLHR